jgi:ribosomal protein S12 methylthiotransferase
VLKAMRRPANQEKTLERIRKWRAEVPDLVLRSSFIVGFPGETDADFEHVLAWLKEARIDRAGCFKYENVTGAASSALPNHVPEEVKEERWHRFMALQAELSDARSKSVIGMTIEVLIDEVDQDGAVGRSKADAPEIDGEVFIADAEGVKPGDLIQARVTAGDQADLWAEPVR